MGPYGTSPAAWPVVSTSATFTLTAVQGDYGVRLEVFNTTADLTTGQNMTSPTVTSGILHLLVNPPAPIAPTIATQPASTTITDNQFANFFVASNGTGPFSYQWQIASAATPAVFSNISGATNQNYSFQGIYALNHLSRFRVVITGVGGNVTSNAAVLTVTPIAPAIISHPVSQTVAVQSPVTFNIVIEGSATNPVIYQWQRSASTPTAFSDIIGATSTSYTTTVLSTDGGSRFRVRISNPATATAGLNSNEAILSLAATACSPPSVPSPTSPANGSQNVALYPTLSWTASSSTPSCPVTYAVRLALDTQSCIGADYLQEYSAAGSTININAALSPLTNYRWCAQARTTGNQSAFSGVFSFQTTTLEVPAPTDLFTLPFTSFDRPAGNRQIILGAYSGERNATGIFYLKLPSGDLEVGRTTIGELPGGRFEISIDVTEYSMESGPREYYARQQRQGGNVPGPASALSVLYFYDSTLIAGLLPPALEKNSTDVGALRWRPVENAASYRVYRRVGLETLEPSTPPPTDSPYQPTGQGAKPFRLQTGLTPLLQDGYLVWTDPNLPTPIPLNGISYFLTALDAQGNPSARSNSQSFGDSVGPVRALNQQIQFLTPNTGRSALGYLCNIHPDGYFEGTNFHENSADMIGFVQVKLKAANLSCAAENYQQASQSLALPFDAINSVNITGFNNCLYVGEIGNLLDNTQYCFKTCLRDMNNNNEANCLEGQGVTTQPDSVPPDFAGIRNLIPQEDGVSLKAEWDPPRYQQILQEPITYVIRATSLFDQDGNPIFDGNEEVREADPSAIDIVIDRLNTGAKYCVRVAARDSNQNMNGNAATICGQTLNNIPFIDSLSVSSDSIQPQKLNLNFRVIDRQRDGVRVSKLEYKTSDASEFIEVNNRSFSGNSDFFVSADNATEAPMQNIVWDTLPYFSGHHDGFQIQLTFQDIQGNETTVQTQPTTAFSAQSRNSSVVRQGSHFGCSSSPRSSPNSNVDMGLIILGLFVALRLRLKRGHANGN